MRLAGSRAFCRLGDTQMASRMKVLQDQQAALQQEASKMLKAAEADGNRKLTETERERFQAIKAEREMVAQELDIEAQAREWEKYQAPVVPMGNEDSPKQAAERKGAETPDGFESFGDQLTAVIRAGMPGGRTDSRLIQAAASGLNESIGPDGGYLVAQQRVAGIRERMYETGQLLNRVNKQPIGAGFNGVKLYAVDEASRADGSRFGGVRVYWTAEAGEKLPSRPKFREIDLKLKKVAGLVYLTDELLQDAVALEAYINRILPLELQFAVENAIIYGTGAGMPLGFMNSGAAVTVTRTTAGSITYEDIMAMWSRMWAPSRSTAVWLIDQSIESKLYGMSLAVGVGGVPVYMPAGGISGAPFSTLFGRPVIPYEHGAALGTAGDIALVDPSQYTLIDKGGVQSASSIHVRFIFDETVLRFVYRVDGAPEWNAPLTPRSGGSTLAPFVILGA
jgi:HK97 family phage major capsid protein